MFRGRCAGGGIWPGGMTLNACEEIWFALFVVERIRMSLLRLLLVLVALGAFLASPRDCTLAAELHPTAALKVAVYDLLPYGTAESDGALSGVSVDLWRRVAEELQWEYKLIPVSQMESTLSGLEKGCFDAAIGAITITPEREGRVDFSYPAHRYGVAVALPSETGPLAAVVSYWRVAADLGSLLVAIACSEKIARLFRSEHALTL